MWAPGWGQQLCRISEWDVQLSSWAVGAEKLFAALDVRQDHASAEAHCVSPAPGNMHCQDLGLGNLPMGDSPRKRTVDHTQLVSIPAVPSQSKSSYLEGPQALLEVVAN